MRTHFRPVLQELRVFYGSETENGGIIHGSYSWCRLTKRQTCGNRINLYLWNRQNKVLTVSRKEANVNPDTRVRDLTDEEVKRISVVIEETQTVEGDLRREIA